MGFKTVSDKPYTKADYYREMEARHAAKIAARAAAVVVVPIKEPEWLEPENELSTNIVEEVVIPYTETSLVSPIPEPIQETPVETIKNAIDIVADEINLPIPKEEPVKKVAKQKRKKSG